jgi:hypothetical protein
VTSFNWSELLPTGENQLGKKKESWNQCFLQAIDKGQRRGNQTQAVSEENSLIFPTRT